MDLFSLNPDAFRSFVRAVVVEVLAAQAGDRPSLPSGRLAYSEPEAAALLGLAPWVLRDERRRGRIAASSVVGRRIRYLRSDLERYLADRRTEATSP
jgi:hypothetical protein